MATPCSQTGKGGLSNPIKRRVVQCSNSFATDTRLRGFIVEFDVVNVDQTVNLYAARQASWELQLISMPRVKLHRIACDCFDCQPNRSGFGGASESAAAARQDPPPKCLVICTEPVLSSPKNGTFADSTSQYGQVPNLDALAERGCCGFVSYRDDLQGMLLMLRLAYVCMRDAATLVHGVTGKKLASLAQLLHQVRLRCSDKRKLSTANLVMLAVGWPCRFSSSHTAACKVCCCFCPFADMQTYVMLTIS